jgi:hypothetical protein
MACAERTAFDRPSGRIGQTGISRRAHDMKRILLWTIGIGVIAAAGAGPAQAGDKTKGCTLATLDSQYLFPSVSTLFPPAFGVKRQTTGSAAGAHVFNGDGTGSDFVTFSLNGVDQHVSSPIPITYTLKADCTGTYQAPSAGLDFDIFVAVDGSWLSLIETDNGATSAQGPLPRVPLKRRLP